MAKAVFWLKNGAKIVLDLLPDAAPNTCASFVWAVKHHIYDGHAIQRIVPGKWVDLSYNAFDKKEAKYLLPNEFDLHPGLTPVPVTAGTACMGGYDELGLAGCEVFFPLTDQPQLTGTYPVFAKIVSGFDEIERLGQGLTFLMKESRSTNLLFHKLSTRLAWNRQISPCLILST